VKRTTSPKPSPAVEPVDLSTLSTADLFKHYKTTAPVEDVRFMLKHAKMSAGLRFAFEVLEASIVELRIRDRKTIYREYETLQTMWRHESNCRHWANGYVESFACTVPVDRLLPAAPDAVQLVVEAA
jgi:hypothetical protein